MLLTLIYRLTLHLRPLLRKGSYLETSLRLATEEQLCGRGADREVEEAGL